MGKFNLMAKLAAFMRSQQDPTAIPVAPLSRKELKLLRPPRYKPAASYTHRGASKTESPCGATPAPTIEQVRVLERRWGFPLIVKMGVIYFKLDEVMYTKQEAVRRMLKEGRTEHPNSTLSAWPHNCVPRHIVRGTT